MSNKNFLLANALHVRIPNEKTTEFRQLLIKANESFPIQCVEENDGDGVMFKLTCETIYFGEAYFHLGALCGKAWAGQLSQQVGYKNEKN